MPGRRRREIPSLDGPGDDGLMPPDPDAILIAQRKAEIAAAAGLNPPVLDPDALLEKRKVEVKEAAAKAATEVPVLTAEEEDEAVELINAGRKERVITLFQRVIHLRTLTIEEELKAAEVAKPYLQSDAYPRAYRTAVVAAAIRTIDNKLLYNPMSEEDFDHIIQKKFEILLGYYPLAVDQIFAKYREMELELLAFVDKLGKSSG